MGGWGPWDNSDLTTALVRALVNFPRPGALAGFSLTFFSKLPSAERGGLGLGNSKRMRAVVDL